MAVISCGLKCRGGYHPPANGRLIASPTVRCDDVLIDMIVPVLIAFVAVFGCAKRVDVYDSLVQGAGDGLGVMIRIVPAMIALLTAVAMLRASGALELAADALAPVLRFLGIPPETVALLLVRPVSGSAALGVGAELIQTYGPESTVGRTAAVMLGSTETTFYTIAVYFGAEIGRAHV